MRTTLTLDDDIAAKLRLEARKSGLPFKQIVNHLLRQGLNASARPQPRTSFRVQPKPLGLAPELSYDNIEALLSRLEGDFHR